MIRFFRRIAFFALGLGFVLAAAPSTRAQDDKDVNTPITKAGSAAGMITIQGLAPFSIGAPGLGMIQIPIVANIDGTTTLRDTSMNLSGVGFKYFISDGMALRFALAFLSNSFGADSINPGEVTITAFGIGAGVEWHMRPLYSTSPYVGAQVSFASSSTDVKTGTGGKDVEDKTSSSNFGIEAIAGFDWFFTKAIAIGAEAYLGFDTQSSSVTQTPVSGASTTTDFPSSSVIALATGATAHVVVYF
jgi:opacity protein-like surface antigen